MTRWTLADVKRLGIVTESTIMIPEFKNPRSVRGRKTRMDGIEFDSKPEAARYVELRTLLRGGLISDLRIHPDYRMVVRGVLVCKYTADFEYVRKGEAVATVEDVKGRQEGAEWEKFRLKAKLFKALFGREIEVYPPAVKIPRRRKP